MSQVASTPLASWDGLHRDSRWREPRSALSARSDAHSRYREIAHTRKDGAWAQGITNRAWGYLKVVQDRLGLAPALAPKDLVAEAIDLSGGHVEFACGVAFLVAMLSALGQWRVQAGTLVLGDLTIQGNIKALPSITEILQMALENGALRVLLPTGNKVQFSSLPEEVVEKMDIIFYSDVDRAITKAVEVY